MSPFSLRMRKLTLCPRRLCLPILLPTTTAYQRWVEWCEEWREVKQAFDFIRFESAPKNTLFSLEITELREPPATSSILSFFRQKWAAFEYDAGRSNTGVPFVELNGPEKLLFERRRIDGSLAVVNGRQRIRTVAFLIGNQQSTDSLGKEALFWLSRDMYAVIVIKIEEVDHSAMIGVEVSASKKALE